MTKPFWWPDAQTIMAFAVVAVFCIVYAHNPTDEAMKGSTITAFAAGYGYLIGSSSGAKRANDRLANATGTDDPKPQTPP